MKLREHGRDGEQPLVLVGLGNGALLERHGLQRYRELDWGDEVRLRDPVRIEFVECRHRSGRRLTDQMKTLWGAFVVSTSSGKINFGDDSGYGPHFTETRSRHGDFALALLPIGAYEPRWFMAPVHLNPAEAVQAHRDLGSSQSIAIHFGTFQLTYETIKTPQNDLMAALSRSNVDPATFRVLPFGQTLLTR